jgi:hypothetical protein
MKNVAMLERAFHAERALADKRGLDGRGRTRGEAGEGPLVNGGGGVDGGVVGGFDERFLR